jgi:pimeloyl-ACP methyl ester carboxylesterase
VRLTPLLEGAHSILLPDLLGFGHSQRVTAPGEHYSHPGQVRLLIGLLDELGVAQVDIIGASYGGAIASQMALEHPERVRRLVLIDAQVFENSGGAAVADLPFGLNRALTWFVLGGGPAAEAVGRSACAPESTTCFGPEFTANRARITRIKNHTEALLAFSHSPRNARVPADLNKMTQPTLVIWGRQDGIIAPELAETIVQAVPNSRLAWVENAGHVPHIEQPTRLAPLIMEFLDKP